MGVGGGLIKDSKELDEFHAVPAFAGLKEIAGPRLFPEGVGLFASKPHDQMVLHHVVHSVPLQKAAVQQGLIQKWMQRCASICQVKFQRQYEENPGTKGLFLFPRGT